MHGRPCASARADIRGCFDNIDHDVLMELLAKRIEDRRFLKLIRSFLQAGYLEDWVYHRTYSGTPQGGTVSPILANTDEKQPGGSGVFFRTMPVANLKP